MWTSSQKLGLVSFIILPFVSEVHEIFKYLSKLFVIFIEKSGKEMRNHHNLAPREIYYSRKMRLWAHTHPYAQVYRSGLENGMPCVK